jgi:gamma-glutamyl-gamma-aminobutyrate hydrolase PuuD
MGGDIGPIDGHTVDHDILYRKVKINVCSRHEHRLTNTPLGANIICKDLEGNVESWKLDNILTVLWHPERMEDFWLPEEWKEIRPW